ncbi:MAG: shikimate dehydrogenase [Beijerinckiaceae bacterium]
MSKDNFTAPALLNADIPKACIIGHPVTHSRSPMIHGYWLKQYDIAGEYGRTDVPPDGFAAFIRDYQSRGFVGANVTVPHKENAFAACKHVTDDARAIGAVNTLWYENGELCGDNTDAGGYIADLDAAFPGWDTTTRHAVVLGAGGAARGIVFALRQRGLDHITILNRNRARADDLAQLYSGIRAADWDEEGRAWKGCDLIINTTSLGMHGQPPLQINLDGLASHAIVSDIVYVPLETDILKAGRERGFRTLNGLGMLLHQATPGFHRWFGVKPAVTQALHDLVAADIRN